MRFHVMTLFPEMIMQGITTSITGRAMEKGIIDVEAVNIRDYTLDKHNKVDDYPYGGGAGMLMQAQPVFDCYQAILEHIREQKKELTPESDAKTPRVLFMTPQGKTFQKVRPFEKSSPWVESSPP